MRRKIDGALQPVPEPEFDTKEYPVGNEEPTETDRRPPEGLILIFPEREVKGFDGKNHHELQVGKFENKATYARVGADGETRLKAVSPHEESVREDIVPTFDQLVNSFDQTLDAVLKTSGLDTETLERVRELVSDNAYDLITEATNTERSGETLAGLLRKSIETHPETERGRKATLLSLETAHRSAIQKAEGAERGNNEQMYKEAMTAVYASERELFNYRATLQPDATPAEIEVMADRAEGFVEIVPEPIYNNGVDAVQGRLKELEDQMRTADSTNNQLAWETARNEFDRHQAVMPILERAEKIRAAEAEAQRLGQEAMDKKLLDKKNTLGKIWGQTGRLQRSRKELATGIKTIEDALRELDKKPATREAGADYAALDQDRKIIAEKLREVEGKIKTLAEERDQLKSVEVSLDLDEHPIAAAKTDLYFELGNMNRENPGMVSEYLGQALSGKDISAGTRDILTTFQNDLTVGRFSEVIPESEIVADEEHDIEPEPTVITSKTKLERAAKLDKMAVGLKTDREVPTIPTSEIVEEKKEYGFGAPEKTRRVTPLRTEAVPKQPENDLVVGETFFPPKVETVEETRDARPAIKGRPGMKAQEIDVPADVLEPTVKPPKDSDKALEEALARFNEAFPPRPSVEETSQIPRPGPKTEHYVPPTLVNEDDKQLSLQRQQGDLWQIANIGWGVDLRDSKSVENALTRLQGKMPDVADLSNLYRDYQELNQPNQEDSGSVPQEEHYTSEAEEQFIKPTGLKLFESAIAQFDNLDAVQDTLIGLGFPKKLLKTSTVENVWQMYEKPSFWSRMTGQAEQVRKAVDLFIQQASTTEGGLSATAGAEMKNKRDQDQNKGGRAKGGLVN